MTPEQIIQIVLWVPFGLIVLISGIIFCVSGYKKGLWRALMALAATVISALISLLLARLLGGVLASFILTKLPEGILAGSGLPEALMAELLSGAIKMSVSLVLFFLFMFILTIILRSVCDLIAKGKLQPKNTLMKWLGMVTGAVSAVCYTLLLLVPLYGTLGAYLPVAESLMSLGGEQDSTAVSYLQQITSHPVVKVSGTGPVGAVYGGLAAMDVGGVSLDVAQMARTADELLTAMQEFSEAEDEEIAEKAAVLIDILRKDVVERPWFYDLIQEGVQMLRAELPTAEDPQAAKLVGEMLDVLSCPQKDFGENCSAILDFMSYSLERDVITILQEEDMQALYETGIIAQAGKLANCSPEAVRVKRLMLSAMMVPVLEIDLEEAERLLDDNGIGMLMDPAQQQREAETVFLMMGFATPLEAEMIMRHPNMGEPVLQKLIASKGFSAAMGIQKEALAAKIDKSPDMQQKLLEKLRTCADRSLNEPNFGDYVEVLTEVAEFAETGLYVGGTNPEPDTYRFALDVLQMKTFTNSTMAAGNEAYLFLRTMLEQIEENPDAIRYEDPYRGESMEDYMQSVVAMTELMCVARRGKLPKSMAEAEESQYIDLEFCLLRCISQNSGHLAVQKLVEQEGVDPLNITSTMNAKQKSTINQMLDRITSEEYLKNVSEQTKSALRERANWLKKFFAIS